LSESQSEPGYVTGGRRLIKELVSSGMNVMAAFWFQDVSGDRRLYIVSRDVVEHGPRETLRNIAQKISLLNGQADFDLFDVNLVSPQDARVINLLNGLPVGGNGEFTIERFTIENSALGETTEIRYLHPYFINMEEIERYSLGIT
jgi:hypothetical protein